MEIETLAATASVDFSLLDLFWRAGWTVKTVMIVLLLASFWTWAIIIQKFINFRRVRRDTERFDAAFWSGEPLDELHSSIDNSPQGASETIFCAAMDEWRRSHRSDGVLITGARSRIERSMIVAVNRETERLSKGLDFLATVGATAPFVGLFGTVLGIMTVFQDIGMQENTNLAVVAPGIGEALAATALGLLAAIPAVIFYNKLSADANALTANFETFADEFSTILSRQMEA